MRALVFCVAVMATACGDNRAAPRDPAPTEDAGTGGPAALAACLDRPTDLSVAPVGQLPCELLPPGFAP